jgi:cell division protein FtsI/penicillin-binding protein 2
MPVIRKPKFDSRPSNRRVATSVPVKKLENADNMSRRTDENITNQRLKLLQFGLGLIAIIFIGRLFQLQVVDGGYYRERVLGSQLKKFELPARRGELYAFDGDKTVPIVLNDARYLVYADPKYSGPAVKKKPELVSRLGAIVSKSEKELQEQLSLEGSRYQILAKSLEKTGLDEVLALEIPGIGYKTIDIRFYPNGALASQLVGFVSGEGQGQYGLEAYFNTQLTGKAGYQRAVTDVRGVPLATSPENIVVAPQDGQDYRLTIDVGMQDFLETTLRDGLASAQSQSGSAVIIETNTGKIKAMANWPTYDPREVGKIENYALFNNDVVSSPLEPGSVIKTLTVGAALDNGVIGREGTYYDPGQTVVDGRPIRNVVNLGAGTRTATDILQLSLNTGVVQLLRGFGGAGEVNQLARTTWYDYLTSRYRFGQKTGIELPNEYPGVIPSPDEGDGLGIRYANMSFGQGMTMTLLQMASASAASTNGGTYYAPTIIDAVKKDQVWQESGPKVVAEGVLSVQASQDLTELMRRVAVANNQPALREGYLVGGKTGTAQIASPSGGITGK